MTTAKSIGGPVICPACGRRVKSRIPKGADHMRRPVWHLGRGDRSNSGCPGQYQLVSAAQQLQDAAGDGGAGGAGT